MSKIALVTCQTLPEADHDAQLLLDMCCSAGLDAGYVPWDDPTVDWASYGMAVIRSTWNSHIHETEFREWVSHAAAVTRLLNPADLILRTLNKRYLLDLQAQGVPIVPTRVLARAGTEPQNTISDIVAETGWADFVVKPAVSASSYLTARFNKDTFEQAERHLQQVLSHSEAMVQPFLHRVAEGGEISIICIDGEITHAVVKKPRFADGHESVSAAVRPSSLQSELAAEILALIQEPWLYARVDLMQFDHEQWVLSELEVIEPSLFLIQNPSAAERLVSAIKARLANRRAPHSELALES